MAKFDIMEIKKRLDEEKAKEQTPIRETIGQKILMVAVTAIALTMFYTFLATYNLTSVTLNAVKVIIVILVILRAVQVFRRKI
jgi:hypothetical protein